MRAFITIPRVLVVITVLLLLSAVSLYLFARYAPNEWVYAHEYREAEGIVTKIEGYHHDHGAFPTNLAVIGIDDKDSGPYYYTLNEDGSYVVWFAGGKSSLACQVYNSNSRKWHESD